MTRKREIHTDDAPPAVGPYSQAVLVGDDLYTAGQIGLDPEDTTLVSDRVTQQAEQVLDNLRAVVRAAGGSFEDTVQTTVYLTDLEDYDAVNEVYEDAFPAPFPARSCVEVCALPGGARVEIDLVARIDDGET